MDAKIKQWILLARKISKFLLTPRQILTDQVITEWIRNEKRSGKILHDLSQPAYYAHQAARRKELDKKYDWSDFIHTQKRKIYRRNILFIGYAASLVLFLTVGTYMFSEKKQQTGIDVTIQPNLLPGSMKAYLTLGNGREIALEKQFTFTEKDGTLIQTNDTGVLFYEKMAKPDTNPQFHILRTPRGAEYHLILADGTDVWINSESELTYPAQFTGKNREVALKGEAYFEIARDQEHPFYVNSSNLQVHATGTAFNVMAYDDDDLLKITLIEGSVNIEENTQVISALSPHWQFALNKTDGTYQITQVDPRTATAWKDGSFFFDNEPLSSIIRKLSRWYSIVIQCSKPQLNQYQFSGEIRKYENVCKVLDMLKMTNEITYTVEENQIIIYPVE